MEPRIQYAQTEDGVSIAYWTLGEGEPLVYMPWFPFGHIELEWQSPEHRRFCEGLARGGLLVHYDGRASGLSDRNVEDLSLEAHVRDLESVVDRLELEQFALWAPIIGAVAIAYAAEHPERVSRLVLWCSIVRAADLTESAQFQGLMALAEKDWDLFTETIASVIFGWSAGEKARQYANLARESSSPETVQASLAILSELDVRALLPSVGAPTLVVHKRDMAYPSLDAGRMLASQIPDARLVVLDGASADIGEDTDTILRVTSEFLGMSKAATVQPPVAAGQGSSRPADVGRRLAGETFGSGRYVVKRLLGQGSLKSVYLAHDTILDRECALSVLNPDSFGQADLARIRREARTLAQFGSQPHVVTVYDYGEDQDVPYIACEYVRGGTLRREMDNARGPLPLDRAISIAEDICRALAAAHRKGIVHRDVRPMTVLLSEDGRAKLGDFGLAATVGRLSADEGGIVGTAMYMPPEQISGFDVDARSDLYAVGAVLYELAAGRPPFVGEDAKAVISQHLHATPQSPKEHTQAVPPGLERLIMKLLAKTKDERPSSAEEVLVDLQRAAAEVAQRTAGNVQTILFTDMEGSTALTRRLGDAAAQRVRRAHNEIVRSALSANGGAEVKHTGDGIMVSFSTASAALGCAIAIQRSVATHRAEHPDSPLAVYIGLNAGEPIAEDDDLFGTSVDLAARLVEHAQPGQIIASDVVRQLAAGKQFLFADLGEVVPKGFEEPVRLYEVRWRD